MQYTQHQLELLDKVKEYMRENNLNQAKMAERLGISKTSLSQLIGGKYGADPKEMFDTIESHFKVKERTQLTYQEVRYADTCISSEICDVIGVCHAMGGLTVIAGDAGIGKTKAAQHYVAEHPSNSVLITVNPCISSIKAVLSELAESLGIPAERSRDALWKAIVRKLSDGTVIIVDEAQHLSLKTIDALRSFSDYFDAHEQTLGLCFIGNSGTAEHIGGKKAGFDQVVNRTKQTEIYSKIHIQRSDIAKLFPILEKEGKEDAIDLLFCIATQTRQALRGAINLFSNAYNNENYSYEGLVAMARHMKMEV